MDYYRVDYTALRQLSKVISWEIYMIIVSVITALLCSYFVGRYLFHQPEPHGPNSNNIKTHTYYDQDIGCYKMLPVPYVCPFAH